MADWFAVPRTVPLASENAMTRITSSLPRRQESPRIVAFALLIVLGLFAYGESPLGPWPVSAATIIVTTISDDNISNDNCTLREAVIAANTNTAVDDCIAGSAVVTDTIRLANGEDHVLTLVGAGENAA